MKSCAHAVTPSDQGAIGGVEPEGQSDHGDQELFIGTVTRAPPVEESTWFTSLSAEHQSSSNWIQEPKRMYCHSVFIRNSGTSHRCWRPVLFFRRMETSR